MDIVLVKNISLPMAWIKLIPAHDRSLVQTRFDIMLAYKQETHTHTQNLKEKGLHYRNTNLYCVVSCIVTVGRLRSEAPEAPEESRLSKSGLMLLTSLFGP